MIDNPMDMYNPYFNAMNMGNMPNNENSNSNSYGNYDSYSDYGKYDSYNNYEKHHEYEMLECNAVSPLPKNPTVTMAYVPFQTKSKLYPDQKALDRGTLFEVLDKPFWGGSAK